MGSDDVEWARLLSQDLNDADAAALANAIMPGGKVSDFAPLSGVLDRTLASHFSQLQSLEVRSALAVCLTAEGDETNPPGTITINGSWPQFKSLHTFKFHGHQVPDEVRSMFLAGSIPTNITLNGWPCKGTHNVFSRHFDYKRDAMRNTVVSFTWKNMDPCIGVLDEMLRFLRETQRGSLESLSMVRPRCEKDCRRTQERFHTGSMALQGFSQLEYLDMDSRFLIPANNLGDDNLTDWLNLPTNIHTLSIDAITKLEAPYVKKYLKNLLEAIKIGTFPKLKDVRCAAIKMKGAEDFKAWMVLENMPGLFLAQKVSLTGWDYDVEEDEELDTIATRVRSRRRRRGAQ